MAACVLVGPGVVTPVWSRALALMEMVWLRQCRGVPVVQMGVTIAPLPPVEGIV